MKKRFTNWIKTSTGIATTVVVVGLILLLIVFLLSNGIALMYRNINPIAQAELNSHNQKLEAIRRDFQSVYQMNDVNLHVSETDIQITICGEECTLEVKLDKEFNVVEADVVDNRILAERTTYICFILLCVFVVCIVSLSVSEVTYKVKSCRKEYRE